jgi:TRAP-type transport system periplasmic protein
MEGKNISLFLVVLFVVVLFFCLPRPAQSQGKVIEFSFSNHQPPEYRISKVLEEWGKEIEKRSKGKVKFTFYHGGTLTSSAKCYEGVIRGLSDIGHSALSYNPGRFPLMEVFELPGYPVFNAHLTTRIVDDIYRKFMPKELSDVHVLYMHGHMPGVLYTTNKPVRKLEDLKGLRIRTTGISAMTMKYLGATPVGMPKSDEYDAMQKGVVDGTLGAPSSLKGWRVAEICKYSTWVPRAGYATAFFVAMNKKKWESLSPDIQNVFTEVSQEWIAKTADGWNALDIESVEYAKKLGHQFIFPDEKEAVRWDKALEPMNGEYLKKAESKGLPGNAALEYRQRLIEKYSKIYKPLFK